MSVYRTHNQKHYANHLTSHSDNRSFMLYSGEELQLLITSPQRYLYVLTGNVTVKHQDGRTVELSSKAEDNRPESLRSGESISIKSIDDAHLFEVGPEALDELHSWDILADHIDDEVLTHRMEMIRGSTCFRQLPSASIQAALECMTMVDVKAGETVTQQGDEGAAFYMIVTGEAEVWVIGLYDDEPQHVLNLKAGDGFGEEALISGGYVDATVKMITDGHLLRMGKSDYQAIVKNVMMDEVNPELTQAMLKDGYNLLDVRYEEEFEEEHLPGSQLIPLHELLVRLDELDSDKHYIAYCRTGGRSTVATVMLTERNFKVVSLKGGICNWPYEKQTD
jgi:rhodanese-related sulfurtransferase